MMENLGALAGILVGYLSIGVAAATIYFANRTAYKSKSIWGGIVLFWPFYHPGFNRDKP